MTGKLFMDQVQGLWKAKHKNLIELHEEALKLKDQFKSFEIHHVLRVGNFFVVVVVIIYVFA